MKLSGSRVKLKMLCGHLTPHDRVAAGGGKEEELSIKGILTGRTAADDNLMLVFDSECTVVCVDSAQFARHKHEI